jgi:hypothetical protein
MHLGIIDQAAVSDTTVSPIVERPLFNGINGIPTDLAGYIIDTMRDAFASIPGVGYPLYRGGRPWVRHTCQSAALQLTNAKWKQRAFSSVSS